MPVKREVLPVVKKRAAIAATEPAKFAVPQTSKLEVLARDEVVKIEHAAPCSIEFSRDAKGQGRWAIKVFGERADMLALVEEIKNIDSALRGIAGEERKNHGGDEGNAGGGE